ncbi:hypothetical protein DZB15_05720 [Klebsiella pneumoniae]|nr:hypothetical protein DZB15_05720 [Klebsiella pneumoniae]
MVLTSVIIINVINNYNVLTMLSILVKGLLMNKKAFYFSLFMDVIIFCVNIRTVKTWLRSSRYCI